MISIRENWRVFSLVFLLIASGVALFVPGVGLGGSSTDTGVTNLQYGLDLAGGAQIQRPLVGMTAEGVDVTPENQDRLRRAIAGNLSGVSEVDVKARSDAATPLSEGGTIEVFAPVSRSEFEAALDTVGVNARIREGVTQPTRDSVVDVLENRIDASGLGGATVQETSVPGAGFFIRIAVPNGNLTGVSELISDRGRVVIAARFPAQENGSTVILMEPVLTPDKEDIVSVGTVQEPNRGTPAYHVPITLSEEGAKKFADAMRQHGFTSPKGTGACGQGLPEDQQYCIVTILNDQPVYDASMGADLAQDIETGDFERDQSFVITATNRSQANELRINLQAGALPTTLDGTAGYENQVSASQAESFKLYSLVTGVVAVIAVSVVVFFRYGDPRVALPMVVTALSEVIILLGFVAAIGYPLNHAHIAGFIAVIGTGADDLIIIADEVMAEGEVSSGRVFQNRFRKAFWVIGAAAATTIIAMSPLLRIRALFGFAIITIIGVIVGVLITRPAYGDILRALLTDR